MTHLKGSNMTENKEEKEMWKAHVHTCEGI